MSELIVLNNEFVTVKYHRDTRIVHHEFHQFLHGEAFRQALQKGLEVMKLHGATKWLSDDRKNRAIPKEDQEWTEKEWAAKAFDAGWRYWAIVLPEKMIGRLTMSRILQDPAIGNNLIVSQFENPEDAYNWLAEQ